MAETREYFYTVDREGRLYHDQSELTDPDFLTFFYKRVRANDTGRHPGHPYLSPCGKELNFIHPADTPLVFSRIETAPATQSGATGPAAETLVYAPGLSVPFDPRGLRFSENGVLYHRAPVGDFARLGSDLTLELGRRIEAWGPYYAFHRGDGRETVIEPLQPTDDLRVLHSRPENGCFGCGGANPVGLGLNFLFDPHARTSRGWLVPGLQLQGGPRRMHGGFIALLLDEVMAKVLTGMDLSGACPTARMEVNFRRPVDLERAIELRGRLLEISGRKYNLRGEIRSPANEDGGDGELLAEAEALYVKLRS